MCLLLFFYSYFTPKYLYKNNSLPLFIRFFLFCANTSVIVVKICVPNYFYGVKKLTKAWSRVYFRGSEYRIPEYWKHPITAQFSVIKLYVLSHIIARHLWIINFVQKSLNLNSRLKCLLPEWSTIWIVDLYPATVA